MIHDEKLYFEKSVCFFFVFCKFDMQENLPFGIMWSSFHSLYVIVSENNLSKRKKLYGVNIPKSEDGLRKSWEIF